MPFERGIAVATLSIMFTLVRFATIAVSVLALVFVLAACGEAVACGGCIHACCVKTDQPDRRRPGVLARLAQACARLIQVVRPTLSMAVAQSPKWASAVPVPQLLAVKVAQLRV